MEDKMAAGAKKAKMTPIYGVELSPFLQLLWYLLTTKGR